MGLFCKRDPIVTSNLRLYDANANVWLVRLLEIPCTKKVSRLLHASWHSQRAVQNTLLLAFYRISRHNCVFCRILVCSSLVCCNFCGEGMQSFAGSTNDQFSCVKERNKNKALLQKRHSLSASLLIGATPCERVTQRLLTTPGTPSQSRVNSVANSTDEQSQRYAIAQNSVLIRHTVAVAVFLIRVYCSNDLHLHEPRTRYVQKSIQ